MSKCYRCGAELTTGDGSNTTCRQCQLNPMAQQGGLAGWICPRCGRGNSPYTATCPCEPLPNKVTCNT